MLTRLSSHAKYMRKFRKKHSEYYKTVKWKKYYKNWAREKRRKKRHLPRIRKCVVCKKAIKNRILSAIYCSDICQQIMFHKRHPNRRKMYSKTYFNKTKKLCVMCKKIIKRRISGKQFCSKKCLNARRKEINKKFHTKVGKEFAEKKMELGCSLCGYNKHGGSLDFHHINPNIKERRIERAQYFYKGKLILKELKKCILVCKNCHYELHDLLRHNIKEYKKRIEIAKKL